MAGYRLINIPDDLWLEVGELISRENRRLGLIKRDDKITKRSVILECLAKWVKETKKIKGKRK